MSKESTAAQACPGCTLPIYYTEYHMRHCANTVVQKTQKKRRRRKRAVRKSD